MYDFLLDGDDHLFVNILTTLRSRSDLKWTLKSIYIERHAINSQNEYLSNYQKRKILERNIKSAIRNMVSTNSTDADCNVNKAMNILEDLRSVKKNSVIRMMGYILIKILKSKLQGLYVNEQKLTMMKSNFDKTPVIFIPSHRSYLDFILMAFICFNYDIEIPYVAAAIDFKNMKIMSTLLKNSGAFFLYRGENAQDVLYRSVLYTYVKYLVTYENSPLQFFIEGARSRTNKSISPKLGILKCIVNLLLKREIEDVTIIPISISYDQLLEDKLYSYELLGIPKPKETTLGLVNSIKNMDANYGNIYINFSTPFSLQKYIKYNQTNENNNESHTLTTLAHEILYRQQHNMILSYFNILAVTLTYNVYKNMTEWVHLDIITDQIGWISVFFKKCGARIETKDSDIKKRVIETVQLHRNFVTLKDNMIQLRKNYSAYNNVSSFNVPENLNCKTEKLNHVFPLILNQLYVNPCLHFIINIAFVTIVSKCQITFKNDILDLEKKFILLRRLFEFEFVFFDGHEKQDFQRSISIHQHVSEKEKELLRCLIISPYISCYRVVYNSLIDTGQKVISEEHIYKSVRTKIQESHTHPYGLAENVIKSALDALNKNNIIEKHTKNETTLYAINNIILSELIQIFDDLMSNGNNLLRSKL